MKIIALLNLKGGVGKTTTSINLAVGLAGKGYKTLLVDMDQQGNTSDFFLEEENATYIEKMLLDENKAEATKTKFNNLWVIPSSLELSLAEKEILLNNKMLQHNRLKKVLDKIKNNFDFCIIDCPPAENILTINILNATNLVIIPYKNDKGAYKGLEMTISNLQEISDGFDLDIDFKLLFTMKNRNNEDKRKLEEFKELRLPMYEKTIRNQPKAVTESGYDKMPVINKRSNKIDKKNVGNDYYSFVEEFIEGNKSPK